MDQIVVSKLVYFRRITVIPGDKPCDHYILNASLVHASHLHYSVVYFLEVDLIIQILATACDFNIECIKNFLIILKMLSRFIYIKANFKYLHLF